MLRLAWPIMIGHVAALARRPAGGERLPPFYPGASELLPRSFGVAHAARLMGRYGVHAAQGLKARSPFRREAASQRSIAADHDRQRQAEHAPPGPPAHARVASEH